MTTTPNSQNNSGSDHKPKVFQSLDQVEAFFAKESRNSIYHFICYISNGEHAPARHHLEWLYYILHPAYPKVNLIAPRGSAKTTAAVYVVAYMIGKNPLKTNMILSSSSEIAEKRLTEVQNIIESQRFKNVFPGVVIDKQKTHTKREFSVKCTLWKGKPISYDRWQNMVRQYGQSYTPTLFANGIMGSGIESKRVTGIMLFDDIHSFRNSATSLLRRKVDNVVKSVALPCLWLSENPKAVSICTRWAEDDFPGTIKEEKSRDGKYIWHTIEVTARDGDGKSYWPEKWGEKELQEAEDGSGPIMFQLMYMNNPKGASSGEFSLDMLRQELPDFPKDFFQEIYISCDFAETTGVKSDYTVLSAMGRDREERFNVYLLDQRRFKRSRVAEKVDEIIKFADQIFGDYGVLTAVIGEKADSAEELDGVRDARPDIPAKSIPVKGGKDDRILFLSRFAQQNRLFVNTNMPTYDIMCSELVGYPSVHDDIPDSMDLVFQLPHWQTAYERVGSVELDTTFML